VPTDGAAEEEDEGFYSQVFVRGGYAQLSDSRSNEVFTDANGGAGLNDGDGGFSVAAGLDLSLLRAQNLGGLNLMGEIFVDYSEYSRKRVSQATSVLLG